MWLSKHFCRVLVKAADYRLYLLVCGISESLATELFSDAVVRSEVLSSVVTVFGFTFSAFSVNDVYNRFRSMFCAYCITESILLCGTLFVLIEATEVV